MRYRVPTPVQISAAILSFGAALVGCARVSRPGLAHSVPLVDPSSSSLYSLASSGARGSIYESQTFSFALDRIDQRQPPLDRTYRHARTGRRGTGDVFDRGIAGDHPELAGRVRTGYTAFPDDPKICNPHGTAVAGAVAGATLGVAPEAEIVDVKMDQCEKLRGTIKAIVDGARWAIADHQSRPGPAVANWSFIADTAARIPALDSAIAVPCAAGIPVIVSAGNLEIDACRVSPGNAQGAVVVGASPIETRVRGGVAQIVDRRAPETAWGPCVDLYAPGDSVRLPTLSRDNAPISQVWNGTSMAAGYVSGAAALYLEAHPDATPDQVTEALKRNATADIVMDAKTPFTKMLYVGSPLQSPRVKIAAR